MFRQLTRFLHIQQFFLYVSKKSNKQIIQLVFYTSLIHNVYSAIDYNKCNIGIYVCVRLNDEEMNDQVIFRFKKNV